MLISRLGLILTVPNINGNIGKKNIVGYIVFEITSNKRSWERFEIYFHVIRKITKNNNKI